jgi:hypothetical protein
MRRVSSAGVPESQSCQIVLYPTISLYKLHRIGLNSSIRKQMAR